MILKNRNGHAVASDDVPQSQKSTIDVANNPIAAAAAVVGGIPPRPSTRVQRQTSLEGILGLEVSFESLYDLDKRLRSGSFATVWKGTHKLSNQVFAVKVIDRRKLSTKDDDAVYREVKIMKSICPNSNIINLVEFFETPTTFHLILELADGGDVFDRLSRRSSYTEKDARDLTRNLLEGVQFLHSKGICHRDLKPENLLLVSERDDAAIKIADFGFAKKIPNAYSFPGYLTTRCGTPAFVSPEVIVGEPYNCKADMWAVGGIIYFLLGGYPAFQHEDTRGLFRKIRAGDYMFHDKYWGDISIEIKNIIASLLTIDPELRITATEALESEWFEQTDRNLSTRNLKSSLSEIKKFSARRKLKGAIHAVKWAMTASFWDGKAVYLNFDDLANKSTTTAVKTRTFNRLYKLNKTITSGSYATVWEGTQLKTNQKVAIKVLSRKDLKPKDDAAVLNEVSILQSLKNSPYIVELLDFFEEPDHFFVVLELMTGGDVFDRIVVRDHYTEKDARDLSRHMLKAVSYMHEMKVVHRDLKPQNLLLKSMDDDTDIKVADFGFSKRLHAPQSLTTRCGTPTYVAPEILKNIPHGEAVDMWSVGVIIYVLLVGYPPFLENNQRKLFLKIRTGSYTFEDQDWRGLSEDAKELIKSLLVVDPKGRMTADEALRSRWICQDDDVLSSRDLRNSLSELKKSLSGRSSIIKVMDTCAPEIVTQGDDSAVPDLMVSCENYGTEVVLA